MNYFTEYYQSIKNGSIVAGQELINLLDRLNADMSSPKWIYDTAHAHYRIEFMERFCRQTKSPYHGKLLVLMLWQKALIEVIYSFKHADTGLRRFKKVLLLIARKNGKSTLCAADQFTDMMIGPGGQDIVCSSNDDAQASIIWNEIDGMRELFDTKNKRTHKNLSFIKNKKTGSKVFKLSDRTRNKEGRNIDKAALDESHEMKNNIIAMAIEQSMSAKDEPLFINITTEGFTNNGYLDKELKYARGVLAGEIPDDTLLPWLYTQDSEAEVWQDENSRYKSNPSLGIVKKVNYLREQVAKAQYDKAHRIFVLAKDFNIKQNNAEAWLMQQDFDYPATFNIDDFNGCAYLGAVDLSETNDLCSTKAMFMRKGDSTKYFYSKYWIPEAKLKENNDGIDYGEMVRSGFVDVCPGNEIDQLKVAEWFYKLYKDRKMRPYKIGYDKWNSKAFVNAMDNLYGWSAGRAESDTLETVLQDPKVMSNPMKVLEADFKSRLINYNENPVDKYCIANTGININNIGLAMPVKVQDNRNRRIDGAVTMIIANAIYQRYAPEYTQLLRS